jgi:hypothetical protein
MLKALSTKNMSQINGGEAGVYGCTTLGGESQAGGIKAKVCVYSNGSVTHETETRLGVISVQTSQEIGRITLTNPSKPNNACSYTVVTATQCQPHPNCKPSSTPKSRPRNAAGGR